MSISKVGGTYAYMYNPQTGRLSTKDGTEDDFTKYYNEGYTDELGERLNGFDSTRKSVFEMWIENLTSTGTIKNDGREYELAEEIVDGGHSYFYLDGEKILDFGTAGDFTVEDLEEEDERFWRPHRIFQHKGYNPVDNSINLAVGDVFDMGRYRLRVTANSVEVEGLQRTREGKYYNIDLLRWGLDSLIRFTEHGVNSAFVCDESMPMLIELLKQLGVDVSRDFIINGTKCKFSDGEICIAEYVPPRKSESYKKMVKEFEECSLLSLKTLKEEFDIKV